MTKTARVLEIAAQVVDYRAKLERLEAELEAMLGGGVQANAEPAPAPTPKKRKPGPSKGLQVDRVARGERRKQIVALVKAGKDANQVAVELGISKDNARVNIMKARLAGDLPKADPKK